MGWSRIFCWGILVFAAPWALAKSSTSLELGAYADGLRERFTVTSVSQSEVSSIFGMARLRKGFSFAKSWSVEPAFMLLAPWRSSYDGGTMTFFSQLDLDLSWSIFSWLAIRVGPSLFIRLVWGRGGSVDLNNGPPPNTSTFYHPEAILLGFSFLAHAGLNFHFAKNWSLLLDAYVLNAMSTDRRDYHAAASIGWNL